MEPISITFSAAGRPFLTTRVSSVVFRDKASLDPAGRDAAAQPASDAPRAPDRTDTGPVAVAPAAGFGSEAQRNAIRSNLDAPSDRVREPQSPDGLSGAERDQVENLKARDAEVRRHERAHAAVGGQYASAPTYTFQLGPDGRRYAVGGEVKIDVAPVSGDPEATIQKMNVVKAAALAPAEPSAADRRVASLADAQRLEAVAELSEQRSAERFMMFADADPETTPVAAGAGPSGQSQPDTRLVEAASLLSRGENMLPGQELNIAA